MLTATLSNPRPCRHGSLRYTLAVLLSALDRNDPTERIVEAGVEEVEAMENCGRSTEEDCRQ